MKLIFSKHEIENNYFIHIFAMQKTTVSKKNSV